MTLNDALTIKNVIDEIGSDIVLKRLKDEAREMLLQAALDSTADINERVGAVISAVRWGFD